MNPIRDRVITQLATLMTASRVARLQYDEVALTDPVSKYVEARSSIPADSQGHRHIILSDSMARVQGAGVGLQPPAVDLEDYLNAQPPGRPFLDFRPDIGLFLFPSPRMPASVCDSR